MFNDRAQGHRRPGGLDQQPSYEEIAAEFELGVTSLAPIFQKAMRLGYGRSVIDTTPSIERMLFLDLSTIVWFIAVATNDASLKTGALAASSLAYRILTRTAPDQLRERCISSNLEFAQSCKELIAALEWKYTLPGILAVFQNFDRDFGTRHSCRAAELYLTFISALELDDALDDANILQVYISELGRYKDQPSEPTGYTVDPSPNVLAAYATLGVQPSCTPEELKSAYHRKVVYWHPDKFHAVDIPHEMSEFASQQLVRINEAYETIEKSRSIRIEPDRVAPRKPHVTQDIRRQESEPETAAIDGRWRIAKIIFRIVWRVSKILLILCFAVGVVAVLFICAILTLKDHWDNQVRIEKGYLSRTTRADDFFNLVSSITWLPREIWGGLATVMTLVLLAVIFAGQWVTQIALEHSLISVAVVSVCFICLAMWASRQEWQAEFNPSPARKPASTSWVMGIVVILALTFSWPHWGETLSRGLSQLHQMIKDSSPPSSRQDTRRSTQSDESKLPESKAFSISASPSDESPAVDDTQSKFIAPLPSTAQSIDRGYLISSDDDFLVGTKLSVGVQGYQFLEVEIQNKTAFPIVFQVSNVAVTSSGEQRDVIPRTVLARFLSTDGKSILSFINGNYWDDGAVIAPISPEERFLVAACGKSCLASVKIQITIMNKIYQFAFGGPKVTAGKGDELNLGVVVETSGHMVQTNPSSYTGPRAIESSCAAYAQRFLNYKITRGSDGNLEPGEKLSATSHYDGYCYVNLILVHDDSHDLAPRYMSSLYRTWLEPDGTWADPPAGIAELQFYGGRRGTRSSVNGRIDDSAEGYRDTEALINLKMGRKFSPIEPIPCSRLQPCVGDEYPPILSRSNPYPECISCPAPEYPQQARDKKIHGDVTLRIDVLPTGDASDILVVHGLDSLLDEKAVEVVRRWKFNPAHRPDGTAIEFHTKVVVTFESQ